MSDGIYREAGRRVEFTPAHYDEVARLTRSAEIINAYHRVLRPPIEGTAMAAIQEHASACGLVAYVFGVHPDRVAELVASNQERAHA